MSSTQDVNQSHLGRTSFQRTLARGLGIALLGLGLASCTIEAKKVEASISEKLKKEDVEFESIKCPSGEKLKSGATFECQGVSDLGDEFTVSVEQTDAQGSIEWDLDGRIVDPEEFTDDVKKKANVSLDCGKQKIIAVKGTKMKCKANGNAVVIKFKNNKGEWDTSALDGL